VQETRLLPQPLPLPLLLLPPGMCRRMPESTGKENQLITFVVTCRLTMTNKRIQRSCMLTCTNLPLHWATECGGCIGPAVAALGLR